MFVVIAVVLRVVSPGPVFYRAIRAGFKGREFTLYKFRSMHVAQELDASIITAKDDTRVFAFGKLLRATKLDELPQLWNIVIGDMSFVGPRPEDPAIVHEHYTLDHFRTLDVLPGLVSPGSIFNYTHGEELLDEEDTERCYVEKLLPTKLALEVIYIERASFLYDIGLMFRTVGVLISRMFGRRQFRNPPEFRFIGRESDWMVSKSPFHETIASN